MRLCRACAETCSTVDFELICFVSKGYSIFVGAPDNLNAKYGATFLITTGAFSFGAIVASWAAANVASDTSRAAAIATVAMGGNTGGLIGVSSSLSR